MKKLIFFAWIALVPTITLASGGGIELMKADVDLKDTASLREGAKLFVNYCLGCHSAQYVRFNRVGKDLGIDEKEIKENLMFTTDKVGNAMKIAMKGSEAKEWFGVNPPDLSVIARARGADWLYTYLMTFYLDPSRPLGVNNLVFKDVGMPHVLWERQGWLQKVEESHGEESHGTPKLEPVDNEVEKKSEQYQKDVRNLVNFLVYIGEPAKLQRYDLGWKVMLFLAFFAVFAYLLKHEYWRDVR